QINCSGATQNCPLGNMPESIAVDITGQFISITNSGDNSIDVFSIDQTSGELTDTHTLSARSIPSAVAYLSDPVEATITPRFAYVANFDGFSLSSYLIDASNGNFSGIGTPIATAGKPTAVTTDLSGSFLYATNDVTDNVSVFAVNSGSGALTEISGSPFPIESNPTGPEFGPISISIDPSGRFAYVANSSDTLSAYSIDNSTGALTLLAGSPFATGDIPSSVIVDPTGRFLYNANLNTDDISAFTINSTTGELTLTGTFAAGDAPNSIVVDPSGRFVYVANNGFLSFNVSAYTIDPLTGTLSSVPGSPFSAGNAPISITVDPLGEFVYVANRSTQNVTPYTINQNTGALTVGTNVATELNPQAITVDPSGRYVYVTNGDSSSVSGYTINATTGALTSTGLTATTGLFPRAIVTTGVVQ
ncbi:MAG: beta-propeller fold lactonase family protein, partial [Candidatus Thiodiazotropha sp. (ex Notomyrtea botanica)]|nr:beta-propeller fold lactonase family protein [Candidatus Thiodiazotropha sp. (ex Notomyrtea botanica)]